MKRHRFYGPRAFSRRTLGLLATAQLASILLLLVAAPGSAVADQASAPDAVRVPLSVLSTYAGQYTPETPPGITPPPGLPPVQVSADPHGLWVTFSVRVRYVPLSATEFFREDHPSEHLRITKDAHGQVTGFVITGADTSLGGPPTLTFDRLH